MSSKTAVGSKDNILVEFLFGGSFDPFHNGHLAVINSLHKMNSAWPVRLMPCSEPVLKTATNVCFRHRIAMIDLALKGDNSIIIDQRENHREGKSFTIETLKDLREENNSKRVLMVIGEDLLTQIKYWHQSQELSNYCHLVVVNRPSERVKNLDELLSSIGFSPVQLLRELEINRSGSYYCLKMEEKAISSTEIRQHLKDGKETKQWITSSVKNYIIQNALY